MITPINGPEDLGLTPETFSSVFQITGKLAIRGNILTRQLDTDTEGTALFPDNIGSDEVVGRISTHQLDFDEDTYLSVMTRVYDEKIGSVDFKERSIANVDISQNRTDDDDPVFGLNFTLMSMRLIVRNTFRTHAATAGLHSSVSRLLADLYIPETELRTVHHMMPRLNEGQGRSLAALLQKIKKDGQQEPN